MAAGPPTGAFQVIAFFQAKGRGILPRIKGWGVCSYSGVCFN